MNSCTKGKFFFFVKPVDRLCLFSTWHCSLPNVGALKNNNTQVIKESKKDYYKEPSCCKIKASLFELMNYWVPGVH